MRIELSGAALAAILLLATGETAESQSTINIAQTDDQPMVITPHPPNAQQLPPPADPGGPGAPYQPAPGAYAPLPAGNTYAPPPGRQAYAPQETNGRGTFGVEEIKDAGHRFFGSISMGLAKAIEYTFQRAGRPNGYILGEEAGGAIIAGVR